MNTNSRFLCRDNLCSRPRNRALEHSQVEPKCRVWHSEISFCPLFPSGGQGPCWWLLHPNRIPHGVARMLPSWRSTARIHLQSHECSAWVYIENNESHTGVFISTTAVLQDMLLTKPTPTDSHDAPSADKSNANFPPRSAGQVQTPAGSNAQTSQFILRDAYRSMAGRYVIFGVFIPALNIPAALFMHSTASFG
jgi:hypothetical protein